MMMSHVTIIMKIDLKKNIRHINRYNGAKHIIFQTIYDYFENVVITTPSQDFKPFCLFQDPHCEELTFPTFWTSLWQPRN
jgi:hypothetical protein